MKPRQDQEQVTAAVAAAVANLTPFVRNGKFEMRNGALAVWLWGPGLSVREAVVRALLRTGGGYDDDRAQYLIEKAIADGDVMIDAVLREVISEKMQTGKLLPPNLNRYAVNHVVLTNQNTQKVNKGGRPAVDLFLRDAVIHTVVEATRSRGFLPARNASPQSPTESASSIVSTALKKLDVTLSEKSIARIWRRLHKWMGE